MTALLSSSKLKENLTEHHIIVRTTGPPIILGGPSTRNASTSTSPLGPTCVLYVSSTSTSTSNFYFLPTADRGRVPASVPVARVAPVRRPEPEPAVPRHFLPRPGLLVPYTDSDTDTSFEDALE